MVKEGKIKKKKAPVSGIEKKTRRARPHIYHRYRLASPLRKYLLLPGLLNTRTSCSENFEFKRTPRERIFRGCSHCSSDSEVRRRNRKKRVSSGVSVSSRGSTDSTCSESSYFSTSSYRSYRNRNRLQKKSKSQIKNKIGRTRSRRTPKGDRKKVKHERLTGKKETKAWQKRLRDRSRLSFRTYRRNNKQNSRLKLTIMQRLLGPRPRIKPSKTVPVLRRIQKGRKLRKRMRNMKKDNMNPYNRKRSQKKLTSARMQSKNEPYFSSTEFCCKATQANLQTTCKSCHKAFSVNSGCVLRNPYTSLMRHVCSSTNALVKEEYPLHSSFLKTHTDLRNSCLKPVKLNRWSYPAKRTATSSSSSDFPEIKKEPNLDAQDLRRVQSTIFKPENTISNKNMTHRSDTSGSCGENRMLANFGAVVKHEIDFPTKIKQENCSDYFGSVNGSLSSRSEEACNKSWASCSEKGKLDCKSDGLNHVPERSKRYIKLRLQDNEGSHWHCTLKRIEKMEKLKKKYCKITKIAINKVHLKFSGQFLSDCVTAEDLRLTNGDTIFVLIS